MIIVKKLFKETVELFRKIHTQYGCLVAVEGALASSINDAEFERIMRRREQARITRQIPTFDTGVQMPGKSDEESVQSVMNPKKEYDYVEDTNWIRYINRAPSIPFVDDSLIEESFTLSSKGRS